MNPIKKYSLLLLVFLSIGCKHKASGDSTLNFLELGNTSTSMMQYVKNQTLGICFVDAKPDSVPSLFGSVSVLQLPSNIALRKNSSEFSGDVQTALAAWVRALGPISGNLPSPSIAPLSEKDGCSPVYSPGGNFKIAQLTVIFVPMQGRDYYDPASSSMYVGPNSPYGVVLHELGHAFGLADLYVPTLYAGMCLLGHTASVMCGSLGNAQDPQSYYYSQLQNDDLNGIRRLYCDQFPNDNSSGCEAVPKPGPTKARDAVDISQALGLSVENFPGLKDNPAARQNNQALWVAYMQSTGNYTIPEDQVPGVVPLPPFELTTPAVIVKTVTKNSVGDKAGLAPNMIIKSINDVSIKSIDEVQWSLQYAQQFPLNFLVYNLDQQSQPPKNILLIPSLTDH